MSLIPVYIDPPLVYIPSVVDGRASGFRKFPPRLDIRTPLKHDDGIYDQGELVFLTGGQGIPCGTFDLDQQHARVRTLVQELCSYQLCGLALLARGRSIRLHKNHIRRFT